MNKLKNEPIGKVSLNEIKTNENRKVYDMKIYEKMGICEIQSLILWLSDRGLLLVDKDIRIKIEKNN